MMSALFSPGELVNGNPSGFKNSKDEVRRRTIKRLDPSIMLHIKGTYIFINQILAI